LARAADADREMVVRSADRGGDGRRHVAILDELDAGARRPDLLDQVVVAWPVEHDRGDVVRLAPECVGDRAHVVSDRPVEPDASSSHRADCHLAHIHLGKLREAAGVADCHHRHGAVVAPRDDGAALERIHRKVDGIAAVPHRHSDGELPLVASDDDPPLDLEPVEAVVHRGRGRLLRPFDVASAQPARASERGRFGDGRVGLAHAAVAVAVHARAITCSTSVRTRPITSSTAASMLLLSITGTPALLARPTR
jgi:hypothetical protein